jgi:hypothetical protein
MLLFPSLCWVIPADSDNSDPVARDAIQIRDRYPTMRLTRYHGTLIGGINIDGAYIYPPLSAMKSTP